MYAGEIVGFGRAARTGQFSLINTQNFKTISPYTERTDFKILGLQKTLIMNQYL